jgi:hypothetical protein
MSKKKSSRQKKLRAAQRATRRKFISVAVIGLILTLCLGTVVGPWRNSSGAKRLKALFSAPVPVPPIPPSNNPSKEYIYAGSKLIATEAPVPLAAPPNLAATTLSDQTPSRVSISWDPSIGADHYEVEKTTKITIAYSSVNSNVTATSFTDNSVNSVTAYLYRVRAVDSVGNVSPFSAIDLATAISFTDDTITSTSTVIKAAHVNELRQAIDAVRETANLSPANWGGAISSGVTTVQATHIQDLRTNLDQARSALGLPQCSYTDNSVAALRTVFIKKEHIDQLRGCVR